jgi:hypothetical protein
MNEKVCTRCGETKGQGDFYMNRGKPRPWCKECLLEDNRTRRERGGYERPRRERDREHRRQWKGRNPEKWKIYKMIYRERKAGRLVPPRECEICGESKPVEAHHEDYSKPLEINWFCHVCHLKYHHGYAMLKAREE